MLHQPPKPPLFRRLPQCKNYDHGWHDDLDSPCAFHSPYSVCRPACCSQRCSLPPAMEPSFMHCTCHELTLRQPAPKPAYGTGMHPFRSSWVPKPSVPRTVILYPSVLQASQGGGNRLPGKWTTLQGSLAQLTLYCVGIDAGPKSQGLSARSHSQVTWPARHAHPKQPTHHHLSAVRSAAGGFCVFRFDIFLTGHFLARSRHELCFSVHSMSYTSRSGHW